MKFISNRVPSFLWCVNSPSFFLSVFQKLNSSFKRKPLCDQMKEGELLPEDKTGRDYLEKLLIKVKNHLTSLLEGSVAYTPCLEVGGTWITGDVIKEAHEKKMEVLFSQCIWEGICVLQIPLGLDLGSSSLVEMAPLIRAPLELFSQLCCMLSKGYAPSPQWWMRLTPCSSMETELVSAD